MNQGSEAKRVKDYFKKSATPAQYDGTNRRAIGLLPEPSGENRKSLPVNDYPNRKRLLVAMEANQHTGCVKVISEKHKSRGAILVFRGRVLGAIYSKAKCQGKLYHAPAFDYVTKELADPETTISAYLLPEALAIATAALFHGQFSQGQLHGSAQEAFSACMRVLIEANMPGCVMANDANNVAVLSAYVFGGKIVGLYSGRQGWLTPTPQVAFQEIAKYHGVKVTSAMLEARSIDEVAALTFGLSALSDLSQQAESGTVDPALRVRDEELAQLKELEKAPKSSSFVSGRNKDALLERELFLESELSHRVNT